MSRDTQPGGLTRRSTMAGAAALGLVAGRAGAQEPAEAAEATGIVSARDAAGGDPVPLPGVLVSNGREIARTDERGRYRLPMPGDGAVFVIKPPGYALPRDADNVPRHSYIHQPGGTPAELGLRYRGLAPTGPLPASIDFTLTRADEPDDFDVVLFTDPQPESRFELDHVRDTAVARAMAIPAAFGLTTGDVLFDDLSLYGRSNRIVGRIGLPWYSLPGNHDLNMQAPDARYSRETWKRVFGAPTYAFRHGRAWFVMLDNVEWLGPPVPVGANTYRGRIGDRGLAFLRNLLAEIPRDDLIVLAMHIPLHTETGPEEPRTHTTDRAALLDLLAGRKVLSLAGHTHTTEHHYLADGHHHHVLTAVSGSWWSGPDTRTGIPSADSRDGTPNGFHVLSIRGTDYTTRYVAAQGQPDETMRILFESELRAGAPEVVRLTRPVQGLRPPVPQDALADTTLVVNVFDGGPRTRLAFRVGDAPPKPMARTRRPDPFVTELYERYPETKKSWVKAVPSTHIWTARLPDDVAPGAHRVTVEGADEYGRPIRGCTVLEVTGERGRG
ncbi:MULTISPECIES: calcineurin-like phosphoesterase family protein [unclassified Methylobacterium]|uniref:calcineurin-like phosphoesterase C-terminal domain-containing protein n=1 Tax=unclassified Methylobacterium TaxID=2615210 RepID=UPI0003686AD3|nr:MULTISPECIES: calcineurin-like phosphoesterase family protein [unclassified Methylobacterium]MBN4096949.1 calcineurin-like phosphoesterase family protein [Methylobacterium sp. OT2]